MIPTARCLAPGFMKRSVDEFKRLSRIAINTEGLDVPTRPYYLLDFTDPDTISTCKTMSDASVGGFSEAHLSQMPANPHSKPPFPAHLRFHGNISTELPSGRLQVQRTGYAAFRNLDRGRTLFGRSFWDIDPYTYLGLRIKSDGRKYFVNVQTDSIVETDIHQHRLYSTRPGEWETVLIKWHEFVRTNHGTVVEPQTEMLRQKVKTVGIGLIDRMPGPFDLGISQIWASNGQRREDIEADHVLGRDAGLEAPGVAEKLGHDKEMRL